MYSEQRDEYLEQVCDMALRKISIISIFGLLTNSTMKIEHYQTGQCCLPCLFVTCRIKMSSLRFYYYCYHYYLTEQDKPLRGLPDSDFINQDLITSFRKHFGMIYNDFNMVLTDFDMKVKVCSKKKLDNCISVNGM